MRSPALIRQRGREVGTWLLAWVPSPYPEIAPRDTATWTFRAHVSSPPSIPDSGPPVRCWVGHYRAKQPGPSAVPVVPEDPDRLALDYYEAYNLQVSGLEEMHRLGHSSPAPDSRWPAAFARQVRAQATVAATPAPRHLGREVDQRASVWSGRNPRTSRRTSPGAVITPSCPCSGRTAVRPWPSAAQSVSVAAL